jgi:2-polyprenyl-3-methyl-5-hydroxy-6-metoxy-1,4-benzoquinol methylase
MALAAERATVVCNLCDSVVPRSSRIWCKDGYDIVRCDACRLLFRFDLPPSNALEEIYGESYFEASPGDDGGRGYLDYIGDEPEHRRNARRRLRLLRSVSMPGRLLDVGCAAGFFLDEARREGWDGCGVEVSHSMAAWAGLHLNVDIERSTFLAARLEAPFDAVTMWDYLEHVVDPRVELLRVRDLLRSGGILALSTGDAGSLVARLSGSHWHLLTPTHHNYFFSRTTLGRYLEESGLEILKSDYLWAGYSIGYVAHKARTLTNSHHLRSLTAMVMRTPLARLEVPLNLYDIVTVVARKR